MTKPTFQYMRMKDASDTCTKYGTAQLWPVVCERCNDVSYIVVPLSLSTAPLVMRALEREHRRCRFYPLSSNRWLDTPEEWATRWEQTFSWIATQVASQPTKGEP